MSDKEPHSIEIMRNGEMLSDMPKRPANALSLGYNYFCFPKFNPPTSKPRDEYFDHTNEGNC